MAKILNHPRVYAFLHVPVQSASDSVLMDMKREYCVDDFKQVVDFLKERWDSSLLQYMCPASFFGRFLIITYCSKKHHLCELGHSFRRENWMCTLVSYVIPGQLGLGLINTDDHRAGVWPFFQRLNGWWAKWANCTHTLATVIWGTTRAIVFLNNDKLLFEIWISVRKRKSNIADGLLKYNAFFKFYD